MSPEIVLWEAGQCGVVVIWPTGVRYSTQAGGVCCNHPSTEGFFQPLALQWERELVALDDVYAPESTATYSRHGSGVTEAEADAIDRLLAMGNGSEQWPNDTGWRVDRAALPKSYEAWVKVARTANDEMTTQIPIGTGGYLTWENSD